MVKLIVVAVVVLVISSAGAFALYNVGKYFDERNNDDVNDEITGNFDSCVNSLNASIEYDPLRCVDSTGRVFVKN